MRKTAEDFNLYIERRSAGNSFAAVVRDSEGTILAASNFSYEFDPSLLATLEDSVGINVRRNAGLVREFGSRLFDTVFRQAVLTCYQMLRDANTRLKLHFEQNERELLRIPWEFMYDGERFLSASPGMTMTRVVQGTPRTRKRKVAGSLRMLTVVSSPLDLPEYYHPRTEEERRIIRRALSSARVSDRMEVKYLDRASAGTIREGFRENKYHILHFTGHGIYSERQQRCFLLLEDDLGTATRVDLDAFSALLSKQPSLCLVVLSCCRTTIAVGHRVLGDLPALLLRKRIPAAIVMQYSVTDRSAASLEREFYSGICNGLPLDLALTNARRALLANKGEGLVDFGTPILYTNAPDCLRIAAGNSAQKATPGLSVVTAASK